MATNGRIKYGIDFEINKNSLSQLTASLQAIQKITAKDLMSKKTSLSLQQANGQLLEIKRSASEVEGALKKSFSTNLGTVNVTKFNEELNKMDLNKIYRDFSKAGSTGIQAFNQISSSVLTANLQLKESHKLLDSLATTMGNTVKWGLTSSIFNNFTGSIQNAWDYSVKLNSSLNDIRVVTGKSTEEMEKFAKQANKAAQGLGAHTKEFTEASLIYYQQGLDQEAPGLAEITLKAANVTGQSGQEVSEQLTAVWNGYNVANEAAEKGMQVYEEYVDKLAAVAAITASDLEEISVGMSKVASAANLMGVDIDQLNAQLATIISVTRQAPESVGTALKTIYARMGDIEAGLDTETDLGTYTKEMANMGFTVLDANGKLRDMGEIIEEIGGKWTTLSREQQIALSQTMAGTRQYNNLLSLFDNWDMYTEALETSADAAGTLQEQQEIYMQRTEAHLAQLQGAWDRLSDTFIDNEGINTLIDGFTGLVNGVSTWVESIGGGGNALLTLGSIATKVFKNQIAQGLNTTIKNFENAKFNAMQLANQLKAIEKLKMASSQKGLKTDVGTDVRYKELQKMQTYVKTLSDEQILKGNQLIDDYANLKSLQQQYQVEKDEALRFMQKIVQSQGQEFDKKAKDIFITGSDSFSQYSIAMQAIENDLQEYNSIIKAVQKSQEEFDEVLRKGSDEKAQAEAYEYLTNSIKDLNEVLKVVQANKNGIINQDLLKQVKSATKELEKIEIDKTSIEGNKANKATINKTIALANKAVAEITAKQNQVEEIVGKESTNYFEDLENKVQNSEDELNDFHNAGQRTGTLENLVDMVGAAGQLASVIGDVASVWEIWQDDSLTTGEKLVKTVSSLSTAILMLGNSLSSLKGGFSALKSLPQLFTGAKGITAGAAAAGKATTAAGGAAGAAGAATIGSVVAAGAAVTGFIAIVYLLVKAWNKDRDAAIEAARVAEEARQVYDGVRASYDQLKSSLDKYHESAKAIHQLTEGTTEWKLAVQDLNSEVLKLLDTYPELANEVVNVNGQLYLTDKGLKELEEQAAQTVANALAAYSSAQIAANKAELKADTTDLRRKVTYQEEVPAQQQTYFDETYNNANQNRRNIYNTRKPETAKVTKMISEEDLDKVVKAYSKAGLAMFASAEEFSKATGIENESLIEALMKNKQSVIELSRDTKANSETNRMLTQQIANSFLGGGETPKESAENTIVGTMIQNQIENREDSEISGKYDSGLFGWSWLGFDNMSDKDIQTAYAEAMGYKTDPAYIENLSGSAKYYDGKEYHTVSDDTARKYLEQQGYYEKYGEDYKEEAQKTVSDFAADVGDEDLAYQILGGDLSKATQEQIDAAEKLDLSSLIDEDLAKQLGYKTADELISALDEDIKNYSPENAINNLQEKANRLIKAAAEELDVTEEELQDYTAELLKNNKALKGNAEFAAEVAIQCYRVAIAAKELQEVLEDANKKKAIEEWLDTGVLTTEASSALSEMKSKLEDLLGVELGDGYGFFNKETFNDIQAALKGDEEALARLQIAAAKDYIVGLNIDDASKQELYDLVDELANQDVTLNTNLDNAELTRKLQEAIQDANLTKDQINSIFGAIGFEPQLTTAKVPTETRMTTSITTPDGKTQTATSKTKTEVDVPTFKSITPNGGGGGLGGNSFRGGGFGSGSSLPTLPTLPTNPPNTSPAKKPTGGASTSTAPTQKEVNSFSGLTKVVDNKMISDMIDRAAASVRDKSSKKSGGSKNEPDVEEKLDKEKDRYHDINIELQQISNSLNKLDKQKGKLFGKNLIDNINKQISLLNKQIDATSRKMKIAQGETDELRNKLSTKGITFESDGTIANYASVYDAQLKYVDGLVEKYNGMSRSAQEKFKDTVDKAKEDFNKFEEEIARYDELTTELIPGFEESIQDSIDQVIELQIESFNMEVELRLDMSEAAKDWNEFKKKIIDEIDDDDTYNNALYALNELKEAYFDSGVVQELTDNINSTLDQLKELKESGKSTIFGLDENALLENLETYYTELMSKLGDASELANLIEESYVQTLQDVNEEMEQQLEFYESVSDIIEHDMNLIKLVYGENTYKELTSYYEEQSQNLNRQLEFQKAQVDFFANEMATLEKEGKKGTEAWEEARDQWTAATAEWQSSIEEGIEFAQEKYLNAINAVFEGINEKLTNGKGLEYIDQQWELINKNSDEYLDNLNAMYGIQQLQNKYLDSIDNSTSTTNQQRLNKLMEQEVESLRAKDKLTQYDLDRADLRYQIALKQIALEESQQNKTSMRLRRDSQGNYSYQYVADEDQISQLQQELSNLYNQLYNLDQAQYSENLEKIYDVWAEYQEKMAEAAQINDPQKRADRKLLIEEQYGELLNNLVANNEDIKNNLYESSSSHMIDLYATNSENYQLMTEQQKEALDRFIQSETDLTGAAFDNLFYLYNENLTAFNNMAQEEKDVIMGSIVPAWNSGIQQMIDAINAEEGGIVTIMEQAMSDISEATIAYEEDLKDLAEKAGVSFEAILEGIDPVLEATKALVGQTTSLMEQYDTEVENIKGVIAALDELEAKYKDVTEAAKAAAEEGYKTLQQEKEDAAKEANKNEENIGKPEPESEPEKQPEPQPQPSAPVVTGPQGNGVPDIGDKVTFTSGVYTADSYGGGSVGTAYLGRQVKITSINSRGSRPYHIATTGGGALGWVKKSQISGYDTGGYTGDWHSNNGKLAFLHQKELVLNSKDTENMLNAIEILRTLNTAVLNKIATITSLNGINNLGMSSETLEQQVHIDANFPNVTSSNEIEEAINNLVNVASQRMNR